MLDIKTEYYFSKIKLTFLAIFIGLCIFGFLYFLFYVDKIFALIFVIPLLIILSVLPKSVRYIYFAIKNTPALILNKDSFINNANGKEYKWTDIKEITYKFYAYSKGQSQNYIELELKDTEKVVRISYPIKCKDEELLNEMRAYHKQYSKSDSFEKLNN